MIESTDRRTVLSAAATDWRANANGKHSDLRREATYMASVLLETVPEPNEIPGRFNPHETAAREGINQRSIDVESAQSIQKLGRDTHLRYRKCKGTKSGPGRVEQGIDGQAKTISESCSCTTYG